MTRFLILYLLLFFSSIRCLSQDNSDEILRELVSRHGQAEVIVESPDPGKVSFMLRNYSVSSINNDLLVLRISPISVESFIQQHYEYRISELHVAKGFRIATNLTGLRQWDSYPTYQQYLQLMTGFAEQFPGLCVLDTIGTSIYGKLVLAIKLSSNAASDENEPEVFYSSSMHGDEPGGFILMLRLIDYLLTNYNVNPEIRNLMDNLEIWINPLANPDGMYKTGNMSGPGISSRFNANGYDLNRNFPDPLRPYNAKNIRQKETTDMMKFLAEHRFVLSANFHSGEEVVNYPWDRWPRLHSDDEWFREISRAYADTVHRYGNAGYMNGFENGIVRGHEWYEVFGGRQDYVTWELQGREVTIEVDDDYITPAAMLPVLWEYNYRSLTGYLENALYGIHGKILNAISSEPVAARIFVINHDRDSSHVYSDTLSGRFARMLAPGSYDLKINAFGYRDTIIQNVTVTALTRTALDIRLIPLIDDAGYPVMYPNPASTIIKTYFPTAFTGTVNYKIYNTSGRLLIDSEIKAEMNTPAGINVSRLAPGVYYVLFYHHLSGRSLSSRFIVVR